jgi:hypothetical protein
MAKRTPEQLAATVRAAQQLIDGEDADRRIGDDESAALLIQATVAQTQLLYATLVRGGGLRNNKRNQEVVAKTQMVLVDLVRKAFALGNNSATMDYEDWIGGPIL